MWNVSERSSSAVTIREVNCDDKREGECAQDLRMTLFRIGGILTVFCVFFIFLVT
jgi:hypothetical protein